MHRFLVPALLLALHLACAVSAEPSNPAYPPPDPLDAAYTSCSTPEDCVLVGLGCCDACNGGTLVSVNSASEATVRDTYSETCPDAYDCTDLGCYQPVATCDAGVCGWQYVAP